MVYVGVVILKGTESRVVYSIVWSDVVQITEVEGEERKKKKVDRKKEKHKVKGNTRMRE